jgi:hypothetical protein
MSNKEILMKKKNKYFFLSLIIFLLLNPLFIATAMVSIANQTIFTEIEKATLGIYFIAWLVIGLIVYVSPMLKEAVKPKPKEKIKTMDEMINDCWKQYRSEKEDEENKSRKETKQRRGV